MASELRWEQARSIETGDGTLWAWRRQDGAVSLETQDGARIFLTPAARDELRELLGRPAMPGQAPAQP